jgi:hypothetical protein
MLTPQVERAVYIPTQEKQLSILITHLLRIFQVLRRVKALKLSSMYVTHHG